MAIAPIDFSPQELEHIASRLGAGIGPQKLAKELGISHAAFRKRIRRANKEVHTRYCRELRRYCFELRDKQGVKS